MPELPEVETVRRSLRPVRRAAHRGGRGVRGRACGGRLPTDFASQLAGRVIEDIERRGKYLLFRLSGGDTLLAHLGMSGALLLQPAGTARAAHDHVRLQLSGDLQLTFNDPRRFGLLTRRARRRVRRARATSAPIRSTTTSHCDDLVALARGRKKPVKNLLMDQRALGGIGNIYANEILFRAAHPPGPASAPADARRAGAAVRRHARRADARHRARRQLDLGLPRRRRPPRLLPPALVGLRPRRQALPALPHAGAPRRARWAQQLLLSQLPAVSCAGVGSTAARRWIARVAVPHGGDLIAPRAMVSASPRMSPSCAARSPQRTTSTGAVHVADDPLGRAAHEEVLQAGAAVRGDDDQIGVALLRGPNDLVGRHAVHHHGRVRHRRPARHPSARARATPACASCSARTRISGLSRSVGIVVRVQRIRRHHGFDHVAEDRPRRRGPPPCGRRGRWRGRRTPRNPWSPGCA